MESTSISVARGASATDNITVAAAPGYTGTLQFSCTGLPANTKCSFQPASLTLSGSTSSGTVAVSIATNTMANLAEPGSPFGTPNRVFLAALLWLPGIVFAAAYKPRRRLARRLGRMAAVLIGCALATFAMGCAGGSSPQSPTGSYTIQVVGHDAAGLSQSVPISVTIQ